MKGHGYTLPYEGNPPGIKALPSVASGDSLPLVGPQPHSVAALKTPVAPLNGGLLKDTHRPLAQSPANRRGFCAFVYLCVKKKFGSFFRYR